VTVGPKMTEDQEQQALAAWLDAKGLLWCHVPNGGSRNVREAAKLKRMGVKPGVPDVLIFERPHQSKGRLPFAKHGVAIELKRADGGPSDVRDSQRRWLDALYDRGWLCKVAFGADDAIVWLESLGY